MVEGGGTRHRAPPPPRFHAPIHNTSAMVDLLEGQVLVIDDDRVVRATLANFFETLGYSAQCVASAAEGRQAAAANAPDLVLIDLLLPEGAGLSLLQSLHRADPELGVIMLAGRADASAAMRAMQH